MKQQVDRGPAFTCAAPARQTTRRPSPGPSRGEGEIAADPAQRGGSQAVVVLSSVRISFLS